MNRAEKAIRLIRQFAKRHMKSSEIKIENQVNQAVWSRGIQKAPRKIRVLMKKDKDDVVTVSLVGLVEEEEREEKEVEEEKKEADEKGEKKTDEAKERQLGERQSIEG